MSAASELPLVHKDIPPTSLGASVEITDELAHVHDLTPVSKRLLGSIAVTAVPENFFGEVVNKTDRFAIDQSLEFVETIHDTVVERIRAVNNKHNRDEDSFLLHPDTIRDNIRLIHTAFDINTEQRRPTQLETQYRQFLTDNVAAARWIRGKHPEIGYIVELKKNLSEQATAEAAQLALVLLAAYGLTAHLKRGQTKIDLARIARDAADK